MINALKKFVANEAQSSGTSNASAHQSTTLGNKKGHSKHFLTAESTAKMAFRKSNKTTVPAGVSRVGSELQKKFACGIDYNIKIVIRGDRNTGKTALWRRLQGMSFLEEEPYTRTEEIQVAPITWNYRTRDFVVKLDIWDVVDVGKRANVAAETGLKIGGTAPGRRSPNAAAEVPIAVKELIGSTACDASTVNVYNGCNGVVFVFDVTKDWTYAYVRRELPNVPANIPVLVMANKMDLVDPDQPAPCTIDECLQFLRVFNERVETNAAVRSGPVPVRFTRASMKRAQGLKFLYNFFNVPFLILQRDFLQNAIKLNTREMRTAGEELDALAGEEGQTVAPLLQDKSEEESDEEDQGGEEVYIEAENETKKSESPPKRKPEKAADAWSSSSSEGINPHVSTYAEDIEEED